MLTLQREYRPPPPGRHKVLMEHDAIKAITHFLVICYPGAILGYESSDAYCNCKAEDGGEGTPNNCTYPEKLELLHARDARMTREQAVPGLPSLCRAELVET